MTNWWQFTEDWDLNNKNGLYTLISGLSKSSNEFAEIYPNPTNGKIAVDIISMPTIANIYTINNKLVQTNILNNTTNLIDVNNLVNGIYIITLQSDKETIVKKFVKQK